MPYEQDVDQFISDLFDFHPAETPERAKTHQEVRSMFKRLAFKVANLLPQTPERTLALRKLADAAREVNYAVSLGQADKPTPRRTPPSEHTDLS